MQQRMLTRISIMAVPLSAGLASSAGGQLSFSDKALSQRSLVRSTSAPLLISMPFDVCVSTTVRRYIKPSSKWHGVMNGKMKYLMKRLSVYVCVRARRFRVSACGHAFCNSHARIDQTIKCLALCQVLSYKEKY